MEKKLYFETLRKSLAIKLSYFDSKITVRYDNILSYMYVVFPPERTLISYVVLDTIRSAGGEISVGYYKDHLEVSFEVLYCE